MGEVYPAHIRDNPIMQGAFASFMGWLWRQDWAHEQFCHETGNVRPSAPKSGFEEMIDKATGHGDAYMEAFVPWAIKAHWGAESVSKDAEG